MPEPLTVTISHRLGRDGAKRRLEDGLGQIRAQLARYVDTIDYNWEDYQLSFRVVAWRQTVIGRIDVLDDAVRVEIGLPLLLRMVANKIIGRVQRHGAKLLGKPKES